MKQAESARAEWLRAMHKIAFPVLSAVAENRLHDTLPLDRKEKQRGVAYLEAVGRTMIGIAPWLELSLPRSTSEEERALQKQYRLSPAKRSPTSVILAQRITAYGIKPAPFSRLTSRSSMQRF